jgi:hypothetical protein
MAEKARCDICDRSFKNSESLAAHNSSKHPELSSPAKSTFTISKKTKNWIVALAVILPVVLLLGWVFSSVFTSANVCQTMPAHQMNIGGHSNLAMHIHPHLTVIIDGIPQLIPADTGIGPGLMRPIHTHDSSGELHVEAQCVRQFYLGEFFDVWGVPFNEDQILSKTSAQGTITITVNGQTTDLYRDIPLNDRDRIVIEFTSF